jgi:hypothetical protein
MLPTLAQGKTIVSAVISEQQRDDLVRLARAATEASQPKCAVASPRT